MSGGSIRITRIHSIPELLKHLPNLTPVYQACFADPPYCEDFSVELVATIWTDFLRFNGLVFVAYVGQTLVGFSAGHGLEFDTAITELLKQQLIPIDAGRTVYMAELGVKHAWRGQDIGERLIDIRLAEIDATQYHWVLMRTSVENLKSTSLYQKRGFIEVPRTRMEITMPRTDGSMRTDTRYFMIRQLVPDA